MDASDVNEGTIRHSEMNKNENKKVTLKFKLMSATVGSMLSTFAITPLDVVKSRFQAQIDARSNTQELTGVRFKNSSDTFRKILKYEGLPGLYRGLVPSLVLQLPATLISIPTYDSMKELLGFQQNQHSLLIPMVSGMTSRILTVIVTLPVELLRTNLQSNPGKRKSFVVFQSIFAQKGFSSLWAGLMPTLLRDAPFSALYWPGYEFIRHLSAWELVLSRRSDMSSFVGDFVAGAVSGGCAAFITTPIDVVKTRRQMNAHQNTNYPTKTMDIIRRIWSEEGLKGFARGVGPRVLRVAPACAITISSYEFCKRYLFNLSS